MKLTEKKALEMLKKQGEKHQMIVGLIIPFAWEIQQGSWQRH